MMSTDYQHTVFTDDELCSGAKTEGTAFGLVLFVYAREHGETPEIAARWLGRLFAPAWEAFRHQGAYGAAREAALNVVSLGASLQNLSGDERRAEVTVTGGPEEEMLGFFQLRQDDADAMFTIFAPIADYLGLQYRWQRQEDVVTMTFEQQAT